MVKLCYCLTIVNNLLLFLVFQIVDLARMSDYKGYAQGVYLVHMPPQFGKHPLSHKIK